jgi:hypothetical protein
MFDDFRLRAAKRRIAENATQGFEGGGHGMQKIQTGDKRKIQAPIMACPDFPEYLGVWAKMSGILRNVRVL